MKKTDYLFNLLERLQIKVKFIDMNINMMKIT